MARPEHPLLEWLRADYGEHPDYDKVVEWFNKKTKRDMVADSVRLIAQGHRKPGWDLAFDIERATDNKVTAHQLRRWPHYVRKSERMKPSKKRAA